MMRRDELIDSLAFWVHAAWARRTVHLLHKSTRNEDGSCTIPADLAARWFERSRTAYPGLSEGSKDDYRADVDLIMPIIDAALEEGGAMKAITEIVADERIERIRDRLSPGWQRKFVEDYFERMRSFEMPSTPRQRNAFEEGVRMMANSVREVIEMTEWPGSVKEDAGGDT